MLGGFSAAILTNDPGMCCRLTNGDFIKVDAVPRFGGLRGHDTLSSVAVNPGGLFAGEQLNLLQIAFVFLIVGNVDRSAEEMMGCFIMSSRKNLTAQGHETL